MKKLNLIVCCDEKMGIGKDGLLPWHVKSEMDHFRMLTVGNGNNALFMGKNTCLSIPSKYFPLRYRKNVVISSSLNESFYGMKDVDILRNIKDIKLYIDSSSFDEYFVIGGETIYKQILENFTDIIGEIHISHIPHDYQCDTFFQFPKNMYTLKERKAYKEFIYEVYVPQL